MHIYYSFNRFAVFVRKQPRAADVSWLVKTPPRYLACLRSFTFLSIPYRTTLECDLNLHDQQLIIRLRRSKALLNAQFKRFRARSRRRCPWMGTAGLEPMNRISIAVAEDLIFDQLDQPPLIVSQALQGNIKRAISRKITQANLLNFDNPSMENGKR